MDFTTSSTWIDISILVLGYLILLLTSGRLLNFILSQIQKREVLKSLWEHDFEATKQLTKEEIDTGWIVGKCENILIPAFIILGAYTALGLIFTAKAIVRMEDIRSNSLFYLAGTMINVTYSVIFGVILKVLITSF